MRKRFYMLKSSALLLFLSLPMVIFAQQNIPGQWQTNGPVLGVSASNIHVNMNNADIIFAGTNNDGLFRSANGGITWIQAQPPLNSGKVTVLREMSNVTYAGLQGSIRNGLYRSLDTGLTWSPVGAPLDSLPVSSIFVDDDTLYVGTGDNRRGYGVYISADAGETWSTAQPPLESIQVRCMIKSGGQLVAGTFGLGIFYSEDGGINWDFATQNGELNFLGLQNVRDIVELNGILFAGTGVDLSNTGVGCFNCSGVFYSTDHGKSWTVCDPPMFNRFIDDLLVRNDTVFAATGSLFGEGLFYSADSGRTWLQPDSVLNDKWVMNLTVGEDVIYAGTSGSGLFFSRDNGRNWQAAGSRELGDKSVSALALTNSGLLAGTLENGLYTGTLEGQVWFPRQVQGNERINDILTGPFYFTAYGSGLYRSIDAGQNWIGADAPLNDIEVHTVVRNGEVLYAGTEENGLYLSRDGLNWLPGPDELKTATVKSLFVSGNTVYAGIYEDYVNNRTGIYRSGDDGQSWLRLNVTGGNVNQITDVGGSLYVCGSQGVFFSRDGGTTWQPTSAPLAGRNVLQLFSIDSLIYAATQSIGLYVSHDGAESWQAVPPPMANKYVNKMIKFGGKIYAATGSANKNIGQQKTGLYFTPDNGLSWQQATLPETNINILDIIIWNGYLIAAGNGCFRSGDGLNWTVLDDGLSAGAINKLHVYDFPDKDWLYAATDNGVYSQELDFEAPEPVSVSISGDITYTSDEDITLLINAKNADFMMISEDTSFTDGSWLDYQPQTAIRLTPGDGNKNINVRFRDISWNVSNVIATEIFLDMTKPQFEEHTSPQNIGSGQSINIVQQVQDENLNTMDLYYRRGGELFSPGRLSLFQGDSAQIEGLFITSRGIDYQIVATDKAGLADTLRNGPLDYFSLPVQLAAGELGSSAGLPGGTGGSAFRIISVPMDPGNGAAAARTFGLPDSYGPDGDWIFWTYNGAGTWSNGPNTNIQQGAGYFLLLRNSRTISNRLPGTTSKTSSGALGQIPGWHLRGGDWTLIGNPYNTPIQTAQLKLKQRNLRLSDPDTSFQVWAYDGRAENGGWTSEIRTLEPWGGLAVYVSSTDTIVFADSYEPFRPPQLLAKIESFADESSWQIQVTGTGQGFADRENFLGMHSEALNSRDTKDKMEPPLIPDGLALSFIQHDKYKLASDFRAPDHNGQIWILNIRGPENSIVDLSFTGTDSLPGNFTAVLLDENTDILRNLRENSLVSVRLPSGSGNKDLKIIVGSKSFIEDNSASMKEIPQKFELFQNYPNPFNPTTTIRYGMPASGVVSLQIFDILGREVHTILNNQKREAGYHEEVINMERFSTGIYFYRLTIDSDTRFQQNRKMLYLR